MSVRYQSDRWDRGTDQFGAGWFGESYLLCGIKGAVCCIVILTSTSTMVTLQNLNSEFVCGLIQVKVTEEKPE